MKNGDESYQAFKRSRETRDACAYAYGIYHRIMEWSYLSTQKHRASSYEARGFFTHATGATEAYYLRKY